MFSFLSGMMGKGGGAVRGATKAGLGGAKPGGFFQQLGDRMQTPQFRQGMAGMGAQMMGLDPALGVAAAQGMQQRQFNNQLGEAIAPIQRSNIDPRQFLPQTKPQLTDIRPDMPMQKPGMGGQLGVVRPEMCAQPQGGGSWQDPRLQQLFGRQSGPRY